MFATTRTNVFDVVSAAVFILCTNSFFNLEFILLKIRSRG